METSLWPSWGVSYGKRGCWGSEDTTISPSGKGSSLPEKGRRCGWGDACRPPPAGRLSLGVVIVLKGVSDQAHAPQPEDEGKVIPFPQSYVVALAGVVARGEGGARQLPGMLPPESRRSPGCLVGGGGQDLPPPQKWGDFPPKGLHLLELFLQRILSLC